MPHQPSPYRFAVFTYLTQLQEMMSSFTTDSSFTLDFHKIFYDAPVLGMEKLMDENFDVILCYSSFGTSIMELYGKPIVIIQKTEADVIRTLVKARELSTNIALVVHKNEYMDIPFFERLLDIRIMEISYNSVESITEEIHKAIDNGVSVIVGGGLSGAIASQYNVPFFAVTPNMQSVKLAVEQAKNMARAQRHARESKEQLITMLKVFREGVICFSRDKTILFSNVKAAELLKLKKNDRDSRLEAYYDRLFLDELVEDSALTTESVITVQGSQLLITALPVTVSDRLKGVVVFISDVNEIQRMTGRIRESQRKTPGFTARYALRDFRGSTPEVLRLKRMAELFALHNAPVCMQGETGTGKEILAQALHNAGPRAEQPFVAVNCAALPVSLLESELFGYEEGAFTGARRGGKLGVFEMAHGGTLFLDEVGHMDAGAQLQLLRVLETGEIMRVGGNRVIPVDVRVLCASHRPLSDLAAEGAFRKDLFYRLAVLRLHVPPLRQRVQDIPEILDALLRRYTRTVAEFTPQMRSALERCTWPGNIRELLAFIESYLILLEGKVFDQALFLELLADWSGNAIHLAQKQPLSRIGQGETLKAQVQSIKKQIVEETMRQCFGNKQAAASRLDISYNTLWRIIGGGSEDDETPRSLGNL